MIKKTLKFILIGYLCTGFPGMLFAQQQLQDSLERVLNSEDLSPKTRVLTMSRLAAVNSYQDMAKAQSLNKEAIQLAQIRQTFGGLTYAWSQQAVLEIRVGNDTLAQQAADSSLFYAQKASPLMRGIALYRKGYVQNMRNYPAEAMKSWHRALPLLNQPKGAQYQASIYYLLYGIYAERSDSTKAARYADLALKEALKSGEPGMITVAWQINGTRYLTQYQATHRPGLLESAVNAFKESIQTFKQNKEWMKNPSAVALSALYLAKIYLEYFPPWFKSAIVDKMNLALRVSRATGNVTMMANAYQMISKLNRRQGDYDAAMKALLHEKNMLDSLSVPNYPLSMNLYQSMAVLAEQMGKNDQALQYYKKYIKFYKKVFNARKHKTIQRLEAKYQDELADKKLQLLQQKQQFRAKRTNLYIAIGIVVAIGLIFLFLTYHFRLKYSLQREKLKDEESSRLQAEQKLMKSEKEQMQKELMAGAMQVEHKNELLQKLKDKWSSQANTKSTKKLERLINEEMRIDGDFEDIKLELKEIHPDFFDQIQHKSPNDLTQLDLKYCAYIYLKLSTKQIATLLNIKPKSVRMAKYRLKQKLELGKDDDLDMWIHDFKSDQ